MHNIYMFRCFVAPNVTGPHEDDTVHTEDGRRDGAEGGEVEE